MPVPSSGQLSTWAVAVNTMAPWCPPNLRAACYTLATDIATSSGTSDATMEAWAAQIWDIASTFSKQRWEYANTTAVAMVVQAGGDTTAIDFTAVLVASGLVPAQARAIANLLITFLASATGPAGPPGPTGPPDGLSVAMSVVFG